MTFATAMQPAPAVWRAEGRQQATRPRHTAFTMTVYQHILAGMQAEAASTFGNFVFGAK
jgi:hypothetical protein